MEWLLLATMRALNWKGELRGFQASASFPQAVPVQYIKRLQRPLMDHLF